MKITLEEIKNPDVRIGPSEYPDALEVAMEEVERLTAENERLRKRSCFECHKRGSLVCAVCVKRHRSEARAEERSLMECGHSKANLVTMVSEKDARATASFCSVCAEVAKAKEDAARDEREACVALVPKVCPACSTNDFGDHVKDAERIGEDEWAAVECECSAIAGAIRARSGGDSDA